MSNVNPYESPQVDSPASRSRKPQPHNRPLALGFVASSIAAGLTYTILDEVVFKPANGAWPMLLGTSAIAIVAAIFTRDLLFAPLCCFAGTMSGDVAAVFIRDWNYAQMHLCIPLAAFFSVPALLVAALFRQKWFPWRTPVDDY